MRAATHPARFLFNGPTAPRGPVLHQWLAGFLVLLCVGVAVPPAMEAMRSLLTVPAGTHTGHPGTSSASELAGLVHLTRERRTLVARQSRGTALPSGELARLDAEHQRALDRLMRMAQTRLPKSDLLALKADWVRLEQATNNPQVSAAGLFILHSQIIDKQLALQSTLAREAN